MKETLQYTIFLRHKAQSKTSRSKVKHH